jgi:hypothetical protein
MKIKSLMGWLVASVLFVLTLTKSQAETIINPNNSAPCQLPNIMENVTGQFDLQWQPAPYPQTPYMAATLEHGQGLFYYTDKRRRGHFEWEPVSDVVVLPDKYAAEGYHSGRAQNGTFVAVADGTATGTPEYSTANQGYHTMKYGLAQQSYWWVLRWTQDDGYWWFDASWAWRWRWQPNIVGYSYTFRSTKCHWLVDSYSWVQGPQ